MPGRRGVQSMSAPAIESPNATLWWAEHARAELLGRIRHRLEYLDLPDPRTADRDDIAQLRRDFGETIAALRIVSPEEVPRVR